MKAHVTSPAFSATVRAKRCLSLLLTRAGLSLLTVVLLISSAPLFSHAQQSQPQIAKSVRSSPAQHQELNRLFSAYQVLELNLKEMTESVEQTGRLTFLTLDSEYELELEPNELRAASFRSTITTDFGLIEEPPSPTTTYKGIVRGVEGSNVRLLIQENLLSGYIRTGNDWWFIDPLSKFSPDARTGQLVVYRDADVRPESSGTCGIAEIKKHAEEFFQTDQPPVVNSIGTREIEIATDADFEFGSGSVENRNAVIRAIINAIDGIYSQEVNLRFTLTFQNAWATSNDPYNSTDPNTLLTLFANEWNNNRKGIRRDLAHLFTGKDLDANIIGIASTGVVCSSPSQSYGLSSQTSPAIIKTVAHEIGHNFNANHDDQFIPPTAVCTGTGPLMCSIFQKNGTNQFSQRSRDDINGFVNTVTAPFFSVTGSSGGLTFTSTTGCSNPASQFIYITNTNPCGRALNWTASSNRSWLSVIATSGTAPSTVRVEVDIAGLSAGTYNGTITFSATGASNSPVSVPVTMTLGAASGSGQVLTNGTFEVSQAPWVLAGAAFHTTTGNYPHLGSGYIYLGGGNYAQGIAYQTTRVPCNATTANLSFWLNVSSSETTATTAYDRVFIELRDTSENLVATLASFSNLDSAAPGVYTLRGNYNLAAYKGQTLRLQFRVFTNPVLPTTFRIDDVSLLWTQ
jgi:hypothetical protein